MDEFVAVGNTRINKTNNAKDNVMSVLKLLKSNSNRPLNIILYRKPLTVEQIENDNLEEKKKKLQLESESSDTFAKKYKEKHGDNEALFSLSETMKSNSEYNVRWKNSIKYKVGNITYQSNGLNTEVLSHGVKENLIKGIVALDKLIGIQNTKVENEPFDKVMELLNDACLETRDSPLILRFQHHKKKFSELDKKPREHEFDITFKYHPLDMNGGGIEMIEEELLNQCIVSTINGDFNSKNVVSGDYNKIHPGLILVGIDGLSIESTPYATVEHLLHYSETPLTLRFYETPKVYLSLDVEDGQRDINFLKKDYINEVITFDTHSSTSRFLVSDSKVPYIQKNETLIGIDGIDVKDLIHNEISDILNKKSNNLGIYNTKKDIQNKHLNLRIEIKKEGITLEEDETMLESEYAEKSKADTMSSLFGAPGSKKNKLSVNLVSKLRKKFKNKELGKIEENQYEVALSTTNGLELCCTPPDPITNIDSGIGSLVYHKDQIKDKSIRKKMSVGDRIVGVDGMYLYDAEHHEIDYLVFDRVKRGKKILRIEKLELKKLEKKRDNEIDIKLSHEDVTHMKWTGTSDFDACVKDDLEDSHPAKTAGVNKGARLIGIAGNDVRVLPFNGVLKNLKKQAKIHKQDGKLELRFQIRNISE